MAKNVNNDVFLSLNETSTPPCGRKIQNRLLIIITILLLIVIETVVIKTKWQRIKIKMMIITELRNIRIIIKK